MHVSIILPHTFIPQHHHAFTLSHHHHHHHMIYYHSIILPPTDQGAASSKIRSITSHPLPHQQIKEPLLLVHHFMHTRPELVATARILLGLTSADFLEQSSFLHRIKPFALMEYMSDQKGAEVCVHACVHVCTCLFVIHV